MNLKRLFIFAFFLLTMSASAQTVKVNEEGRKIVEYADGTWRYFEEEDKKEKKKKVKEARAPKKEKKEKKVKTSDSKDKQTNKVSVEEKEEEFKARMEAIREAEKRTRMAKKLDIEAKTYSQNRLFLETELAVKRNEEGVINQEEKEILERRVIKAIEDETAIRIKANEQLKEAQFYEELVYMTIKKREKALAKYEAAKAEKKIELLVNKSKETKDLKAINTTNKESNPKTYKKYNPKNDVILNPPLFECKLSKDEVDEFTGNRIRTTEPQLFFTYTRDALRPYFTDKEHTVCHASTTTMDGGIYVFSLEIAVASKTAREEYGGLLRDGTILIVLLDGSTISMVNNRSDRGKYDAIRDTYVFRGNYQIPPRQVKDLLEGEIDKIRVVWEKGYDTYEIYEMDFLKNHLSCFE